MATESLLEFEQIHRNFFFSIYKFEYSYIKKERQFNIYFHFGIVLSILGPTGESFKNYYW